MTKKPKAIICDIDGTVANVNHRLHYLETKPKDWKGFFSEAVNDTPLPTKDIIRALSLIDERFICLLVTGREESHRRDTGLWLQKHFIYYDRIFMRQNGDRREDTIIKKEIYHEHIEPNFDVCMVFEDRTRLVEMYRSLGLFVFDCNQTGKVY